MAQRVFDVENEKDMADLWSILPDNVCKIEFSCGEVILVYGNGFRYSIDDIDKETKCVAEWCRQFGIKTNTYYQRIKKSGLKIYQLPHPAPYRRNVDIETNRKPKDYPTDTRTLRY